MKYVASISRWPALVAACAMLLGLATGCSSTGSFNGQTTGTDVSLNQKNYRVIKPGAIGKSYGFRLLGIIPFANPTYATAKAHLYKSTGEPLTGRAIALANQTEDRSSIYLILFSIPKVTVTADVIEFTEQPKAE
ncbi:MAG TPA: DUF6567 family protein [Verrucomicrobiae bacterium]|nr:DUF6567 family protein [Verrucomicrobiae bacterium]